MVEPIIRIGSDVDTSSENYKALQTHLAAEGIALPESSPARLSYKTDYSADLTLRLDSVKNAVDYFLDSIPVQEDSFAFLTLKGRIDDARTILNKKHNDLLQKIQSLGTLDTVQKLKSARGYIRKFILHAAVALQPILDDKNVAFFSPDLSNKEKLFQTLKLLDRMEEFYIASKPRPTLCTITQDGEGNLHAQVDKPVNVFAKRLDNRLYNEFSSIKEQDKNNPAWYIRLTQPVKWMITKLATIVIPNGDAEANTHTLSSRNDLIPGVRNFLEHQSITVSTPGKITASSSLRSSHVGIRPDEKNEKTTKEQAEGIAIANTEQVILTAAHQLAEKTIDLESLPKNGDGHPVINSLFLFQTLITPIPFWEPDVTLSKNKEKAIAIFQRNYPDGIQLTVGRQIVVVKFDIISTNHAMNVGRYLMPTYRGKTAEESLKLCDKAVAILNTRLSADSNNSTLYSKGKDKRLLACKSLKEFNQVNNEFDATARRFKNVGDIGKVSENQHLIQAILHQRQLLNYSYVKICKTQARNRELHLAAQEQFITRKLGGIPYGSCVSGKDRKGLETLYTDAMEIYCSRYGKLPLFEDKGQDRLNFTFIMAKLYLSEHAQTIASDNALGSAGIKTPHIYLPDDVQAAIIRLTGNPDALTISEQLANNNDLSHFVEKNHSDETYNRIITAIGTEQIKIVEEEKNVQAQKIAQQINEVQSGTAEKSKQSDSRTDLHQHRASWMAAAPRQFLPAPSAVPVNEPEKNTISKALGELNNFIIEELKKETKLVVIGGHRVTLTSHNKTTEEVVITQTLRELMDFVSQSFAEVEKKNNKLTPEEFTELTQTLKDFSDQLEEKSTGKTFFRTQHAKNLYKDIKQEIDKVRQNLLPPESPAPTLS